MVLDGEISIIGRWKRGVGMEIWVSSCGMEMKGWHWCISRSRGWYRHDIMDGDVRRDVKHRRRLTWLTVVTRIVHSKQWLW